MGNEQDRSIHRLDRIKDLIFGNRIECRCYFIKQIKIGFSQKRSCDRDPLHLSLRKVLLSKHIKVRIIAMGQTFDSFVQTVARQILLVGNVKYFYTHLEEKRTLFCPASLYFGFRSILFYFFLFKKSRLVKNGF